MLPDDHPGGLFTVSSFKLLVSFGASDVFSSLHRWWIQDFRLRGADLKRQLSRLGTNLGF